MNTASSGYRRDDHFRIAFATCYYEHFRQETLRQLAESSLELDRQIAKLKKAEEALKKNQEELERRVEKRTDQLKTANEELRREIVSRKETEALLRSSEERYRLLFENSFDVIFSIDLQGIFVSSSPTASSGRVKHGRPGPLPQAPARPAIGHLPNRSRRTLTSGPALEMAELGGEVWYTPGTRGRDASGWGSVSTGKAGEEAGKDRFGPASPARVRAGLAAPG